MVQKEKNAINTFKILVVLIFILACSFKPQDHTKFLDRLVVDIFMKSYRLPQAIKADCDWNYAVMILRTNKENKVVKVDFVNNEIKNEFRNSLKIINGYQFSKSLKIDQRPLVMILTVDQRGGVGCIAPTLYSPSEVTQRILFNIDKQVRAEPNSLVFHNPLELVAGGKSH